MLLIGALNPFGCLIRLGAQSVWVLTGSHAKSESFAKSEAGAESEVGAESEAGAGQQDLSWQGY